MRKGYLSDGWFIGQVACDFSNPVTDNLTLTAKWTHQDPNKAWRINPDKGILLALDTGMTGMGGMLASHRHRSNCFTLRTSKTGRVPSLQSGEPAVVPIPTEYGRHLLLNDGKVPVVALGHVRELQTSRLIPRVSAGATVAGPNLRAVVDQPVRGNGMGTTC